MYKESDIMWEGEKFWVSRDAKAYTVNEMNSTHSVSIQSFAKTEDGLSLAVAYAQYKEHVLRTKYETEMHVRRLEDPTKFVIRIAQYLSRQYPDAMKVISAMQSA